MADATIGVAPSSDAPVLGVDRSLCGNRWRLRPADDRLARLLGQRHDLPDVVARLLAARGVQPDTAAAFLEPTLKELLPDPSCLKDMEAAAARLADAVAGGEAMAVFGDYDVDGATSAAVLHRYMAALGVGLRIYVPDRLTEGYGPNAAALATLRGEGCTLAITVDCGILAHEPLAAARASGLDVIVVDHHAAESALPPAVAVVNPNRLDEDSGLGQLAAVGVTFLLVVALNRELRRRGFFDGRAEPDIAGLLDLVALGTVCDVVPLVGLNRAFVRQGLRIMARRSNIGLAALAEAAGVRETPGAYHAGFLLGPRVNAGGRVGSADMGARLLTTEDAGVARELAARLDGYNRERQAIEAAVLQAAIAQAEDRDDRGPVLIAAGEGWHPGVIGIVASRLVERFGVPACVIGHDGGVGKGSGRSIAGVDLGAAIIAARQAGLLVNGGGHPMAAGFTLDPGRIDALSAFLAERLHDAVVERRRDPSLTLDTVLTVEGADRALLAHLDRAAPFGVGNPEPRFALARARIARADVVGDRHVRCFLAGDAGGRLKAIAFRAMEGPLGPALLSGQGTLLHLAGRLRADRWQGRDDVQFQIDDGAAAAGRHDPAG